MAARLSGAPVTCKLGGGPEEAAKAGASGSTAGPAPTTAIAARSPARRLLDESLCNGDVTNASFDTAASEANATNTNDKIGRLATISASQAARRPMCVKGPRHKYLSRE
mmetsp:Transcript_1599/g.4069  ORF Transcript_1599/g.4069 Transcript_1599/m.4069 type:complete len:109 (+) Transcript_1599:313-639(+)